ncbi:hypothetical protein C453_12926 [Haloferax elongans ATCC BAA-1513]|uniref:Uncharacterized protein n=1 Tax=Haloferax elongans ATCC BAA-1513 TaxID=1230453 RepID=M0HIS6_HALEO|nr:hypothetical protein [Haloferax elongans]ELZ84450.1 hypothetical protein C453_12926 [Haloferax elongans ATCC BAA-1513]
MPHPDLSNTIERALESSEGAVVGEEFGVDIHRIIAPDEPHDFVHPVLAIVVEFDNGAVFADWNIDAWPDDEQLDAPHVSIYGSLDDLGRVTEGTLEHLTRVTGR